MAPLPTTPDSDFLFAASASEISVVLGNSPAEDNSDESDREDDDCPPSFSSATLASAKKEAGRVVAGEVVDKTESR